MEDVQRADKGVAASLTGLSVRSEAGYFESRALLLPLLDPPMTF
jgi:hypothetical protein